MSEKINKIIISPNEALNLELKLNKSPYGTTWRNLGDVLYACRLNPNSVSVSQTEYTITYEQASWIKQNIKKDTYDKVYTFLY
jgi:hypothetical protein